MSKINNGGPAFPLQSIGPDFAPGYSGMTLRDWFAGQALVAMEARRWGGDSADTVMQVDARASASTITQVDACASAARAAYATADAMLKEREAGQ